MNNKLTAKAQKVDKTALIHGMIRAIKTTDDLMPWGKHLFVQKYITSMLALGDRAWIIDRGCSYEKFCKLLKGEFIEFKPENRISLNPFTFIENLDESMPMLKPLIAAMASLTKTASVEELAFIEKTIKAVWRDYGNEATIATVCKWLKAQKDTKCKNLGNLLHVFSGNSKCGRYFEGACTIHIDNPIIVLNLQDLKAQENLQKIVLLAAIYQMSEIMYLRNHNQFKTCIVDDDAWNLLSEGEDSAASFIEASYMTVCKHITF